MAELTAKQWNERYPVGTPVVAYPATRDGWSLVSQTRTPAWTLGHGTPVVSVEGYAGGICLTHVAPVAGTDVLAAPELEYIVRPAPRPGVYGTPLEIRENPATGRWCVVEALSDLGVRRALLPDGWQLEWSVPTGGIYCWPTGWAAVKAAEGALSMAGAS